MGADRVGAAGAGAMVPLPCSPGSVSTGLTGSAGTGVTGTGETAPPSPTDPPFCPLLLAVIMTATLSR